MAEENKVIEALGNVVAIIKQGRISRGSVNTIAGHLLVLDQMARDVYDAPYRDKRDEISRIFGEMRETYLPDRIGDYLKAVYYQEHEWLMEISGLLARKKMLDVNNRTIVKTYAELTAMLKSSLISIEYANAVYAHLMTIDDLLFEFYTRRYREERVAIKNGDRRLKRDYIEGKLSLGEYLMHAFGEALRWFGAVSKLLSVRQVITTMPTVIASDVLEEGMMVPPMPEGRSGGESSSDSPTTVGEEGEEDNGSDTGGDNYGRTDYEDS